LFAAILSTDQSGVKTLRFYPSGMNRFFSCYRKVTYRIYTYRAEGKYLPVSSSHRGVN